MSFTTIIGIVVGIGLFVGAIFMATDNFMIFVSVSSFVMVIGGTTAATLISYEFRYFWLAMKLITRIFRAPNMARGQLTSEVGRVVKWGYLMQKKGVPALEQEASKVGEEDRFLGWAVEIVISGYTGAETRTMLVTAIESAFNRNTVPVDILKSMASGAPAFGMIGTLIGLVIMLANLGGDPSQLGQGLAVALITTLYGVLFARLVFLPAAAKIQQREEIMRFRNLLIAEGMALLADRKGPRNIQDHMNAYLDQAIHFNIDTMKD